MLSILTARVKIEDHSSTTTILYTTIILLLYYYLMVLVFFKIIFSNGNSYSILHISSISFNLIPACFFQM